MGSVDTRPPDLSVSSPALAGPVAAAAVVPPAPVLRVGGRPVRMPVAVTAILAMAAVSALLAATSDHVEYPAATALYYAWIVAASLLAGLAWSLRRPGSRFGRLLALF